MAARASLTVYDAVPGGLTATLAVGVVADGHKFVNDGKTVLVVVNSEAVGHTITIETPSTVEGLAIAEDIVSLAATANLIKIIGPFSREVFNQADGNVYVDYEVGHEADVSVCAVRINPELH